MNELSPPRPVRRQFAWPPSMAVFACALGLRLWVLLQITGTTYFLPNQGDMKFYSDWALRIASGVWTDHQAFYGLPGYAFLLAAIYKVAGYQPYLAVLLQTGAEACTAWLIYLIAVHVSQPRADEEARVQPEAVGWAAALAWVCFIPAQAYSVILMPTAFLVAAFWFVVWWIVRPRTGRPALREFLLLGLMMGIVAMMVANILFLIPLILAAIWLRWPWADARPHLRRLAAAGCLLGSVWVGASPCWLHNRFVAGEPVFLSAHSGINFWLGNNAEATGYPKIPSGFRADQKGMLMDSITWAERAEGRPLRHSEVSEFWNERAREYIRASPGAWLRLEARKLGNFWNAFQYDDLGVVTSLREDGILLPGFGFGVAAALALPGMALAAMRRPRARWVMAATGLHMASLMTVFVTERYRLAAAPGLLILGAVGLAELWRAIAARRWQPVAVYAGVAVAAAFIVWRPVDSTLRHLDDYNTAIADMEDGRLDRAQVRLERVYAANPDNAATNFALGNLWLARNDRGKTKYFYRRALQLDPRQEQVLNNLGVLAMEEKRWQLAEQFLIGCLALEPDDAKTNYLLAQTRVAQSNLDGASSALDAALRLKPGQPDYQKLRAEIDQRRNAGTP